MRVVNLDEIFEKGDLRCDIFPSVEEKFLGEDELSVLVGAIIVEMAEALDQCL